MRSDYYPPPPSIEGEIVDALHRASTAHQAELYRALRELQNRCVRAEREKDEAKHETERLRKKNFELFDRIGSLEKRLEKALEVRAAPVEPGSPPPPAPTEPDAAPVDEVAF